MDLDDFQRGWVCGTFTVPGSTAENGAWGERPVPQAGGVARGPERAVRRFAVEIVETTRPLTSLVAELACREKAAAEALVLAI